MEVFSRLLHSRYESGYIHYHPNTDALNISHLMFADDVMIFFNGSSSSLHGVSETLDDFASWSGLEMNHDKTQLFHAGLNQSETNVIARYGFQAGSFPIKYLGLPLMYRKLRVAEYAPLIDKVAGRFRSWAVRFLSFAGRLQLIASVITGTVNFWITTFVLPRGCIKKIESLCNRFLWAGSIEGNYMAKVSWNSVCMPKKEGGLGLRRFSVWNTTLCLRLIWLIFSGSKSLWVAWHKHHHLNNMSFWAIKEHQRDSGSWKSLLNLRPLAERFVTCSVGNGLNAKFWYDSWTPLGPLIKLLGENGPRSLRVPLNAVVATACNDVGWKLASPRSEAAVSLHSPLTTIQLPSCSTIEDSFDWTIEGSATNSFSSKLTWNAIRRREEEKDWYKAIWFRGATPKHAFFMWTAQLNRLPTRMRLASWGSNVQTSCCFCSAFNEDRDHLMLWCGFSVDIWTVVLRRLGTSPFFFQSWTALLAWVKLRSANAPPLLRKLVVQTTLYFLWIERNNRIFNSQVKSTTQIFRDIDRHIINTISARRHRKAFDKLTLLWLQ